MSNTNDFQNTVNFLKTIISESKPTKKITDNDLKNADYEAIQQHTKIYSDYLESYVEEYKIKSENQQTMKTWFFRIVMALLCLFVLGGIATVVIVCLKKAITISDVATVITAVVGSVSSFLILPKVIAENLFPSKEEDQTAAIFGKMFDHDINIRNLYRIPVSLDNKDKSSPKDDNT